MGLDRVNSVAIRPDRITDFQERVAELASAARDGESWHWTAHQTNFGEGFAVHFASRAETFEEIASQGQAEDLWVRVLGAKKGAEGFARASECIQALQQTISIERPDLSYAEGIESPDEYPFAVVTAARARPGHAEGCEELIRKVAEAIPKVGDAARMMTYQVMFGQLNSYWTVRPLRGLADLDRQLPAQDLLNQAFGNAEGGLLWRSGSEAIEEGRREIIRYVPELSNPPS